jgi:hypothetical protein
MAASRRAIRATICASRGASMSCASLRTQWSPRKQERLILADATQKFERLLITRIFGTHDIATFAELAYIARASWSGTLRGHALTAQQIAYTIGMPRTTVLRKLQGYVISDTALQTITPALDRAIKLILETADALRAVQNGPQKS